MARRLGVTPSAVSQACKPGGILHPALTDGGKGINVLHEATRAWLERKAEKRPPIKGAAPIIMTEAPPDEPDHDTTPTPEEAEAALGPWRSQVDLESLLEPLSTLTEKYGDSKEFAAWIKCRRALEEALKAQMLRERVAGRLIARTTVARLMDHVDTAFRFLLADAPRTVATRIAPNDMARTAAIIRDVMEAILDRARLGMAQSLEADNPESPLEVAAE